MSEKQISVKDALELKNLIIGGTENIIDFEVPFYKEVKNTNLVVKLRPLSTFEYDKINIDMYKVIDNQQVIDEIFSYSDDELKDLTEEEKKKKLTEKAKKHKLERYKAIVHRDILISYYAMKDFIEDLTLDIVEQMDGTDDIAKKVNEISGRTSEMLDKIKSFREKQKELNVKEFTEES